MKKIIFSAESISNLKRIYNHTKKHFSDTKAKKTINLLFEKIQILEKYPQIGKTSGISSFLKELIIEGNTIYYQINGDFIEIIYIKPRKTIIKK